MTQKSAWHMLHRIRLAMQTGSFEKLMKGEIEVDETFIGGKAKNMHKTVRARKIKSTGGAGKAIVQGLLERGGRAHCEVVPNTKRETLQGKIQQNVERGQTVYTDEYLAYKGLDADYVHAVIDHAKSYVEGRVHTNGLENFWSLLKRTLHGTYVAVKPEHLGRYLDEQTFRFNKRKGSDYTRFLEVMLSVAGKRLTFKGLTAAEA